MSILLTLLVLNGNPLILYPLSLLSAASVLLVLSMLYTIMLLSIFRRENEALRSVDILLPFTLGFIITIIQIALLDAGRFWLTHTWNGFPSHLGGINILSFFEYH